MSISDAASGRNTLCAEAPTAACPYETSETGSRNYCSASIMTVVTNSFQKINYCWTDNYDSCPLFLSKVMRKR